MSAEAVRELATAAAAQQNNAATAGGAALIAKELAAGTIAGMAQVLSGQPFDIVKVRLQSSNAYSGTLDAATRILKEEGPKGFYKGTAMPLVGIGACVSLQFAFLQAGKRYFTEKNASQAGRRAPADELSSLQYYLAGAGAGVGNSIVSGPVEHVRIRLQTQTGSSASSYSGPVDVLKKVYRTDGLRGVYTGQATTLAREFHGYGMYFLGYEALVARELKSKGITRKELPLSSSVLYGAAAGYCMWLSMYPLDVIKSRIQTDGLPSQAGTPEKKFNGAVDCAKQLWREAGAKGFFRGLTPTLIRSPVVNGITFLCFEQVMRVIT